MCHVAWLHVDSYDAFDYMVGQRQNHEMPVQSDLLPRCLIIDTAVFGCVRADEI